MATKLNVNELYCEACACMEQGLCYDEIDDVVSFAFGIAIRKELMQKLRKKKRKDRR